ncbi:thioredoxin [Helicobacter burdigaliensis]|uniref:thioredoxin n=1 Tax=Helicobacter burdigaliensis TaxID=2315334 RepID=UPI000EF670E6|nr:thioredoxin [Helicobacter burdigaliensis]
MAGYIELTEQNFEETIKDGVVMVDFWAPWCNPCKMISPVIDKLAAEYAGKAKICKVNTDDQQELAMKFGIRSIPTIFFYKDGQKVDEMIGAASEQDFRNKIDSLL